MKKKPLLSIGMIFRNDIRCIERCLSALEPLRQAIPCELVMADTGSTDGSREVAERYADQVIDFPWVDDFSAARNAVMDRCAGTWYLSVDTDEYLDADISELMDFLCSTRKKDYIVAAVAIRNYRDRDMSGEYSDFYAVRLLRMSTGMRYEGRIHEQWPFPEDRPVPGKPLQKTVFHHDGYVDLYGEGGRAKRARNVMLLRKELEERPDNLRQIMQFLESGREEPDYQEQLFRALELVRSKGTGWQSYGPPVIRMAVMEALLHNLPQMEEWVDWAAENCADSYFFRIDIASCAAIFYHKGAAQDPEKCIHFGEIYLRGLEDLRAGRGNMSGLLVSSLNYSNAYQRQNVHIALAGAYRQTGNMEKSLTQLAAVDFMAIDARQLAEVCNALYPLHSGSGLDTAPVMAALWEGVSRDGAAMEKALLTASGATLFAREYLEKERREGAVRPACTVFLPLTGGHMLGDAAAIMSAGSTSEAMALLRAVSDWSELPSAVLAHVVTSGARFPLPGWPLKLEEMDTLAGCLSQDQESLRGILEETTAKDYTVNMQTLAWTRALALAAVRGFEWTDDAPDGAALARTFAGVEGAFLSRYYAADILSEQNIHVLPPMHRFGWYCTQAFDALDAGDAAGYARLLRAGLETNPAMKAMVEYLTDHTPELQKAQPSGELLALAEQVRMLLAAYAPDDPAVLVLKQSAAYQKVAHLIEGPEPGLFGGLPQ